jgi:hypothetical protein
MFLDLPTIAACVARPRSWMQLLVLAAISVTAGNTWFALNRYGLHQCLDYVLYIFKIKGPARAKTFTYLDELGLYVYKSLHTPDGSARAWQHIAFRVSTVLLALTLGELLLVFAIFHASNSPFVAQESKMEIVGVAAIAVGIWQMVITRRIDYYIVNPPPTLPKKA